MSIGFRFCFERRYLATPKDYNTREVLTARKELKQEPEEMITMYYERLVDMMGHLHTRS